MGCIPGQARLRYCIWYDWKKPERKRKNLIRLGVAQKLRQKGFLNLKRNA